MARPTRRAEDQILVWHKLHDHILHSDRAAVDIGVFALKVVMTTNAGALIALLAAIEGLERCAGCAGVFLRSHDRCGRGSSIVYLPKLGHGIPLARISDQVSGAWGQAAFKWGPADGKNYDLGNYFNGVRIIHLVRLRHLDGNFKY